MYQYYRNEQQSQLKKKKKIVWIYLVVIDEKQDSYGRCDDNPYSATHCILELAHCDCDSFENMKISKSNKIRIGVFSFVLEYKLYFTPLKDSPAAQEQSIFGQRNNT